tara:strand:- start:1530 stop:1730 length:201 start_codon:yes stop_codon:yes gene_type:complete
MEEYKDSDGVATREFKRLRNEIREKDSITSKQNQELRRFKTMATAARHILFKKKLITPEEVVEWNS